MKTRLFVLFVVIFSMVTVQDSYGKTRKSSGKKSVSTYVSSGGGITLNTKHGSVSVGGNVDSEGNVSVGGGVSVYTKRGDIHVGGNTSSTNTGGNYQGGTGRVRMTSLDIPMQDNGPKQVRQTSVNRPLPRSGRY